MSTALISSFALVNLEAQRQAGLISLGEVTATREAILESKNAFILTGGLLALFHNLVRIHDEAILECPSGASDPLLRFPLFQSVSSDLRETLWTLLAARRHVAQGILTAQDFADLVTSLEDSEVVPLIEVLEHLGARILVEQAQREAIPLAEFLGTIRANLP